MKKVEKQTRKENIFFRTLDKLLKLDRLKLLKLTIGFLKGFEVQVEFYEEK